ncbi:MAG: hypothetical protein HYV96_19705 [Opitutae bacterium]|nr:hypothetical protein [Opitutae bacterium]
MSTTSIPAAPEAVLDETVVLPAEAFFVRRVPLDPVAEATDQVELALEMHAPFALGQLFYGYLRATDGASALVFATHRRRFAAEGWDGAAAVLPAFAALLGEPPTHRKARLWSDGASLIVVAWDGEGTLPALVLARQVEPATEAAERDRLLADAGARLGDLGPTEEFVGPITVAAKKQIWEFSVARRAGGTLATAFDENAAATMDVRDKEVLATRRATQQRDRFLWRVLQTTLGCIAFAAVLELALFLGGILLNQQREAQRVLAPDVEKIQTAQALGTRIEEMAQRRLRAMEMLAVVNSVRPTGIVFSRSTTSGRDTLEVEGQSANADNVGTFESAVRALPQVATLEVSNVGLRDGLTTFRFVTTFKDGSLRDIAGTGGAK